MYQVALVAKENFLAEGVVSALRESGECCVHRLDTQQIKPAGTSLPALSVVVVDWRTVAGDLPNLLLGLSRSHPEALLVLIVPGQECQAAKNQAQAGHFAEAYTAFGVDEVLTLPGNEVQMRDMIAHLLAKIACFDRLLSLQNKLRQEMRQSQIVAKSKAMREIMQRLPDLWDSTSTVLLTGETGTGKELIARAIHYLGPRQNKPFITVDCGTLPEHLIENELFGHVRGAYTDANSTYYGLIHEANGGTLFLDEVEALPLGAQAKFLRLLQEQQYRPLGQAKYVAVDLHVIAATNQNLAEAVAQHAFRQDLYYRLEGIKISIPPLRKRKADIPALVDYFLKKFACGSNSPVRAPDSTLQNWLDHPWPGNVRELENKVRTWLAQANAEAPFPAALAANPPPLRTLAEARQQALKVCDCQYLHDLLRHTKGNISAAARFAGIHRKSLGALLKKYGIEAQAYRL